MIKTILLLGSISSDHLVFVLFELLLTSFKSLLFFNGQDHISLGLFFLLVLNSCELLVFLNHFLNNVVDLLFLGKVFCVGFSSNLLLSLDLTLNVLFILDKSICL